MPDSLTSRTASPKRLQGNCAVIALCTPKGGTGKTTFAENLLVLASAEGKKCLGLDFDPQVSLTKWYNRRLQAHKNKPDLPMFTVASLDIADWRAGLRRCAGHDLAVLDMMPSVDHAVDKIFGLCGAVDLVLVTTGCTMVDLDSTIPWIERLTGLGFPVAACMNRVNRRETFTAASRAQLNRIGELCPVDVRNLADMHQPSVDGLAACDHVRAKGLSDFIGVWDFVKRRVAIPVKAGGS